MFDWNNSTKKKTEFIQEYAYVEDYSLYYEPKDKKEKDEDQRGIAVIDLNDDNTFKF